MVKLSYGIHSFKCTSNVYVCSQMLLKHTLGGYLLYAGTCVCTWQFKGFAMTGDNCRSQSRSTTTTSFIEGWCITLGFASNWMECHPTIHNNDLLREPNRKGRVFIPIYLRYSVKFKIWVSLKPSCYVQQFSLFVLFVSFGFIHA